MVTTPSKHGLRAAATARRDKHAQRTPLPPKPGQVEDTIEVLKFAAQQPDRTTQYGRMTAQELREQIIAMGGTPRRSSNKGELLTVLLRMQQAAGRTPPETYATEPSPAVPGELEAKGAAKAERLQAVVQPHGWTVDIASGPPGRVQAVLTRDIEAIHLAWNDGVFEYESATYAVGERTTKIRNVSQAKQLAARDASTARNELSRVSSNKAWKRKDTGTPTKGRIPFDPDSIPDEELLQVLSGRVIKWHNRLSQNTEQGVVGAVGAGSRFFRVQHVGEDRVVQFLCPSTGFRAFRMSDLLSVSAGRR